MEIFLIIAALIFLIFGSMLLLSPQVVEKISKKTNRMLFYLDDNIRGWCRPLGIFLLAVSIFLWYVAWWKGKL